MKNAILESPEEIQRQRIQANVWENETVRMLRIIGIKKGWQCADVGCGAVGILKPLSVLVGESGKVIGIERDHSVINYSKRHLKEEELNNTEIKEADFFSNDIANDSFDFVHARYMMSYIESKKLLERMIAMAKPGGVVCSQEPDQYSWNYFAEIPQWKRFKEILEQSFAILGNINIGREVFPLFQKSGLKDVRVHAAVLALSNSHPYMRSPILIMNALKEAAFKNGVTTESELHELTQVLEKHIANPRTVMVTFTTIQVWGIK